MQEVTKFQIQNEMAIMPSLDEMAAISPEFDSFLKKVMKREMVMSLSEGDHGPNYGFTDHFVCTADVRLRPAIYTAKKTGIWADKEAGIPVEYSLLKGCVGPFFNPQFSGDKCLILATPENQKEDLSGSISFDEDEIISIMENEDIYFLGSPSHFLINY